jgi:hypothetical protein
MSCLVERYAQRVVGQLSCLDRVVIMGTLPGACYAEGMTHILYRRSIRIFDYAQFANPLADQVKSNAERLAAEAGVQIQYVKKLNFRKEDRVRQVLTARGGDHPGPGLVHVFSALEPCASYQPWHDKRTGKTYLKPDSGKCLHYYFYFIDPILGLCYLRVPTYCPFRLQFSFNGHNWLKAQLDRAVHAVKVDQVATFLSRKITGNYQGEAGGSFSTRIEGTCIKHHMGRAAAIKMYDKLGRVLRIETTVNDVSFFKHHRTVEHKDGTRSFKLANLPKRIYSLPVLTKLMGDANRRYLAFISELPDGGPGLQAVQKLAEKTRDTDQDRPVRGFNLLQRQDHELFCAIARGEFAISGMTNCRLRAVLKGKTAAQLSRLLRALRLHGLIKKVGRTYKYYLTELGRRATVAALKLRDLLIVPALAHPC